MHNHIWPSEQYFSLSIFAKISPFVAINLVPCHWLLLIWKGLKLPSKSHAPLKLFQSKYVNWNVLLFQNLTMLHNIFFQLDLKIDKVILVLKILLYISFYKIVLKISTTLLFLDNFVVIHSKKKKISNLNNTPFKFNSLSCKQ